MDSPHGIGFDPSGNIYFSDGNNNRIRKITVSTGVITTAVGTATGGFNGNGIPATSAYISTPWGLTLDAAGNIYFCDLSNNYVRKVTASTGLISNIAGAAPSGTPFPTNSGYNGDNIPADSAKLYQPTGLAVDAVGNVYIADLYNSRIRKITASTGIISTLAGDGGNSYNGDGILATSASLGGPTGVAVDAAGNIYIADNENNRVRKITLSTGIISTIAGNGGMGFSGDGGQASLAQLKPYAICLDNAGNIYVTDGQNSRVRKIDAATGIINTIAGTGSNGYNGDGIAAITAQVQIVTGIAVDASGNVYIADSGNNRIRKISSGTATGISEITLTEGNVTLYPNPSSAGFVLSFEKEQKNMQISIMDIQGKVVKSSDFSGNQYSVAKGELKTGVYFINVKKENRIVVSKKVVIE